MQIATCVANELMRDFYIMQVFTERSYKKKEARNFSQTDNNVISQPQLRDYKQQESNYKNRIIPYHNYGILKKLF